MKVLIFLDLFFYMEYNIFMGIIAPSYQGNVVSMMHIRYQIRQIKYLNIQLDITHSQLTHLLMLPQEYNEMC